MSAAIDSARASVLYFARRIEEPMAGQTFVSVKLPLEQDGQVEHVWASIIAYEGTIFVGILDNAPVNLPKWSVGDTIRVSRDSISDWMLVAKDTVYGAFSVHALRDRMTASERQELDRGRGVVFPAKPRALPPSD